MRIFFTFILLCTFCLPALAENTPLNVEGIGDLPVLHEGRIKPVSKMAELELKHINGSSKIAKMDATEWLSLTLFSPAQSVLLPIIKVAPSTRERLQLDKDRTHFSLKELADPVAKSAEDAAILVEKSQTEKITKYDRSFLKLHDRVFVYNQLLRSLSLALPLNVRMPDTYASADYALSYLELLRTDSEIQNLARAIGTPLNDEEKHIVTLAQQTRLIRAGGADNVFFKIMPPQWEQDGENWYSPWELILQGKGSPKSQDYLRQWQQLARAYNADNQKLWNETLDKMYPMVSAYKSKLSAEKFYASFDPFYWAEVGYGLTLFFLLMWLMRRQSMFWRPAFLCFSAAVFFHVIGLILRVYILSRAPVATLYESLLFVGLATVISAMIAEWRKWLNRGVGIGLGAISGFGLLIAAHAVDIGQDNKGVLAAVLNSNFWLSTHVIIITLGYAATLMAALYSHYLLFNRNNITKFLQFIVIAALCLMTIGTILGGIWADQSWGRFWGWDPKENGALLIVLWLIWLLHGKFSGHIIGRYYLAGLSYSTVILALSWFGVNLLGVGLHAYGFFEGWLGILAVFGLAETALIVYLWKRYED